MKIQTTPFKAKLKNSCQEAMGDVMDQVQEVKGVKVLAVRADGVDMTTQSERPLRRSEKRCCDVIRS